MGPDTLRQVKDSLETLLEVQAKAAKLEATVTKLGKMTPAVTQSIRSCQSLPELESVAALYKSGSKVREQFGEKI